MDTFTIVFIAVAMLVVCFFFYRMIRHGGFKAAMFGARIDRTVGEVAGEKQGGLVSVTVRVHILRREPAEKLVGIEFLAKSVASYQMMPVTLSESQAKSLAVLIDEAVRA